MQEFATIKPLEEYSYFIKVVNYENMFIHYQSGNYVIKGGFKGACIFHKKEALEFLDFFKNSNFDYEMIEVFKVTRNDFNLN